LQTKKGKTAKSTTQQEWFDVLSAIIHAAHEAWVCKFPRRPFKECPFVYDNPSFHQLSEVDKLRLLHQTPLEDLCQLQQPARYSGDMMQCIEHVHAIICQAWYKERLTQGTQTDHVERGKTLQRIFRSHITSESVTKNVVRLRKLLQHLVNTGTGEYAPLKLV